MPTQSLSLNKIYTNESEFNSSCNVKRHFLLKQRKVKNNNIYSHNNNNNNIIIIIIVSLDLRSLGVVLFQ